jgi:hypothetical protein
MSKLASREVDERKAVLGWDGTGRELVTGHHLPTVKIHHHTRDHSNCIERIGKQITMSREHYGV